MDKSGESRDQFGRRKVRSRLRHIEDLLTDEQRESLLNDLAEMAKQRRAAEAFGAHYPMAASTVGPHIGSDAQ